MVSPASNRTVIAGPEEFAGIDTACRTIDFRCISIRDSAGFHRATCSKFPVTKFAPSSRLRRRRRLRLNAAVTPCASSYAAHNLSTDLLGPGARSVPSRSPSPDFECWRRHARVYCRWCMVDAHHAQYRRGLWLVKGTFSSCQVIVRQLCNLLEEVRTGFVVEQPRRKRFGRMRQSGACFGLYGMGCGAEFRNVKNSSGRGHVLS